MFKGLLSVLEKAVFWFIFLCVAVFFYSVISATVFGILPTSGIVVVLDLIAMLWCFFAGTLPTLYMGALKVKSWFDTYE